MIYNAWLPQLGSLMFLFHFIDKLLLQTVAGKEKTNKAECYMSDTDQSWALPLQKEMVNKITLIGKYNRLYLTFYKLHKKWHNYLCYVVYIM